MFILCSPHNPVSRVWSEQELETIFSICKKHNVLVVSDEIHQDFSYGNPKFISSAVLSDGKYKDMLILLNSGSKTFNLAGLTHSHTIIFNEKLMQKYDKYIQSVGLPEQNTFGIIGMREAFAGGEEWLRNVKEVILHNYNYIKDTFAEKAPKIIITPLEGTYLTWIDLRNYLNPSEVTKFITEKCGLAVDAGEWFSEKSHGFIRINLATHPKYVKAATEAIINNL